MRLALDNGAEEAVLLSDSELVVQQLLGNYQVRSESLRRLWDAARALMQQFRRCEVRHIPRDQNAHANRLAQEAASAAREAADAGRTVNLQSAVVEPHRANALSQGGRSSVKIAPSILSADFRRLGEVVRELQVAGADWVHFDVMDGHFVPNISFGLPVIESLRSETSLPFDVHLMVTAPERYLEAFVKAGANIVAVHAEATYHLHRAVARLKELGVKAGVALNPATPPELVRPILPLLDVVLVMTVDPGFAGQRFLPFVLDKVRTLRQWIDERGLPVEITVDGGVTVTTAPECVRQGATVLVSASGIFQSGLPLTEAVNALRRAALAAQRTLA